MRHYGCNSSFWGKVSGSRMCGVRDKLSLTLFPRVKELLSVQVSIGANLPTKMTWVKNMVCCCVAEDKEQCYLLNLFFLFPWVRWSFDMCISGRMKLSCWINLKIMGLPWLPIRVIGCYIIYISSLWLIFR